MNLEEMELRTREDKEQYFENYTVPHPKLIGVLKKLKKEIYASSNSDILMVVGPSGVGKSKLFQETLKLVYKDFQEEMVNDKSLIPISGIELPNPDLGKFSWKDFYYRVLTELNEPLIDYKVDYEHFLNNNGKNNVTQKKSSTAQELRRSVENAFIHRKTKAFLIDEAQHFFNIGTRSISTTQFNSIKSLANMANTKIVLFGTYQLNDVINLDGQLSRRVNELHLPRYNYVDKKDIKFFKNILYSFQKNLPVEVEPDFISHHEFLYEYSVGCTGVLKKWLQRCLSDALDEDADTITMENLKRNALQTRKLITLADEAIRGEVNFSEDENDLESLKTLLGTSNEKSDNPNRKKGNKSPGQRKPDRDKVGIS